MVLDPYELMRLSARSKSYHDVVSAINRNRSRSSEGPGFDLLRVCKFAKSCAMAYRQGRVINVSTVDIVELRLRRTGHVSIRIKQGHTRPLNPRRQAGYATKYTTGPGNRPRLGALASRRLVGRDFCPGHRMRPYCRMLAPFPQLCCSMNQDSTTQVQS